MEDKRRYYEIPSNFIDESRMLKGMFKTRNFVEGVIMAMIVALISFAIPVPDHNARIVLLISLSGPFFLIGNAGFNGDAISTTLLNAKNWRKKRGVMLYNNTPRALIKSPIEALCDEEQIRDKIVDFIDNRKEKQRQKFANQQITDYIFAVDTDLDGIYADQYVVQYTDSNGNIVSQDEIQEIKNRGEENFYDA